MDKNLLALTVACTEAKAALVAAKTDAETATAMTVLTSAMDAKAKYSKRTRTDELEEDDGAEDSAPATSESPKSSEPAKSEDAKAADSEDAAAGDDEDAKALRGKALSALRGRPTTAAAVYDAIVALTGEHDLNSALGALEGMKARIEGVAKLEERVARIESASARDKVSSMLAKASTEGRVAPAQIEHLRAQGMKDPKWLKGYLASLPKTATVRTVEDGPLAPRATEGAQSDFALETMTPAVRKMYEASAVAAGLTLEAFLEKAKSTAVKMTPVRPTH